MYDDTRNDCQWVAESILRVTQVPELDAYRIMMKAHKTGMAVVNDRLCFEVAELYNEGLRKKGLLTEIVPTPRL